MTAMIKPGKQLSFTVRHGDKLADVEKRLILMTVAAHASKPSAAKTLGISLRTLYNRIEQYSK